MPRHKRGRTGKRPKGSYPLPTGGYMVEAADRTGKGRTIRIRAVHRDEPDVQKVVYALIGIAKRSQDQADSSDDD